MLADDVVLFLELEKTFFQRKEFDLVIARTGEQAVALAATERPDLIFMDLFMPEMNGNEACRRIKDDPELKSIPIVMVTQGGRDEDIALCRAADCDEVLFKPINRHLFMETANRFLDLVDRRHTRIMVRLQISYGAAPQLMLSNYALNICDGGLFIATSRPEMIEGPLALEFCLPGRSEPLRCQGRVAWINEPGNLKRQTLPPGFGVEFIGLGHDDLEMVQEFIKQECLTPSW